jgi:hypothetical protein
MNLRFICPHCRVSVDPAALELSRSDGSEFRVCPHCDTPVLLAAPTGGALSPGLDVASDGVDQRNLSGAAA